MSHSLQNAVPCTGARWPRVGLLLVALGCAPRVGAQASSPVEVPAYTLTFSDSAVNRIHVASSFALSSDTLRMSAAMAAQLKDGWATFVHDLKAYDGAQTVALTPLPGGRWLVAAPHPARLSLTYDVVVAHDSVRWNVSGDWARAYSRDHTVFFTGRAVFIVSNGAPSTPVRVRFQLPHGWSIATPYRAVASDPSLFEASSLTDLWTNGNLAGTLVTNELRVGDLQLVLAGSASMREGIAAYAATFDPVIKAYSSMMNGAPSRKLVVMTGVAPSAGNTGGESFRQSVSTLFNEMPSTQNRAFWSYTVAHELFHQWNPNALPPARQPPFEWFVEGFTDYMAQQALLRTGIITEQEFLTRVAAAYTRYTAVAGKISLSAAGPEKGANYDLIYFGGSTLAAALDVELRERTGGARGIPQLMAHMYASFKQTNAAYDYDGLVRLINEIAGADESGLLARYVNGTDIIPLESFLARAGVTLGRRDGAVVVDRSADATPAQKAVLAAIFTK